MEPRTDYPNDRPFGMGNEVSNVADATQLALAT
jgi:hypothetical protein